MAAATLSPSRPVAGRPSIVNRTVAGPASGSRRNIEPPQAERAEIVGKGPPGERRRQRPGGGGGGGSAAVAVGGDGAGLAGPKSVGEGRRREGMVECGGVRTIEKK